MSTSTPPIPMSIESAFNALEQAQTTLLNDQQQQTNQQGLIDKDQAKLDADKAVKIPMDQNVSTDISAYNAACDQAASTILASKIVVDPTV